MMLLCSVSQIDVEGDELSVLEGLKDSFYKVRQVVVGGPHVYARTVLIALTINVCARYK